jgi:phosphatidyl-myo-inositol dimannoside synthase
MNVLLISRKWPPAVGGMEKCTYQLAQHLAQLKQVEVIALPGRANGGAPQPLSIAAFGLATSMRLLARPAPAIVHVADIASWPLAWIAALRHPRSRIILSAHGSDLSYAERPGWRGRMYGAYVRFGARRLRRSTVIANSNWIAGLARQAGWAEVVTIPLGADAPQSDTANSHNGALLFAGRIMRAKGLAFLVEQVLPLVPENVRVRLAGTIWDEDEARVLEHPRVDYLGQLDADELAKEYRAALCTVVPSLGPEGFGLAAVEAAAAGGVVIASNHSGLAEAVLPESGFLVEAGNADAWARQIRKVASWSHADRRAFVERSSAAARERFSWKRVAEQTLAVYESPARAEPVIRRSRRGSSVPCR